MFGSKKRKARSAAYHDNIRSLLKGSKPNGGFGYDVEEAARIEQAAQAYEVRRHTDKRGRVQP